MVSTMPARVLGRRVLMTRSGGGRGVLAGASAAARGWGAAAASAVARGGGARPFSAGGSDSAGTQAGQRKGVQITVGDSQTYSKKCDPYEQGGKPLTKDEAAKLLSTVLVAQKLEHLSIEDVTGARVESIGMLFVPGEIMGLAG